MRTSVFYACNRILLALLFNIGSTCISAQPVEVKDSLEGIVKLQSADPFGRNSPRATVKSFISAISEKDYLKASNYLNLSQIPDSLSGEEMAKKLQNVLDKGGLRPLSRISKDSLGRDDDELPMELDRVGVVETK